MHRIRLPFLIAALPLCAVLLQQVNVALAEAPPYTDYCRRLQQEVQGKKHGFMAGNVTYYVGGFHASWRLQEHETLGLTHPFHHDLRSRGVGLATSRGAGHEDTGIGNDFSGWEFYKDTRVLYGSVVIGAKTYRHPVPTKMYWRPDRMICEYSVGGVRLREEKFIAVNDSACSIITSSEPVTLRFNGRSFFGRSSLTSTATVEYDTARNAIHIVEGGTTRCRPETDRSEHVAPIMYEGMSTVLSASRPFAKSHRFTRGDNGEWLYEFDIACDSQGVAVAWAMHDKYDEAIGDALAVLGRDSRANSPNRVSTATLDPLRDDSARQAMAAKTDVMNRQLNKEVPWFRCSDKRFEDIYYYLWSLYLMYYIDVQRGWEMEPHTQTAVNNFLGMHRYDATFQIKVGAWTGNKRHYAYGNVLTWKHLFRAGHFRRSSNGVIALADNKGTTWHSGVYGNELSEHVLGAWRIYQHTGDTGFIRDCYEDYFREVFQQRIAPFASNHFEVAEALIEMARATGHPEDIPHWRSLVSQRPEDVRVWFDQRWQANGHANFFAGPKDGMLMTNSLWHLRSRHFPRDYALKMTKAWALDRDKGFYGKMFPTAMSRQAMKTFATKVDQSFGYTPDTAYFTLSGLFQQRLGDPAWRLTLNHLEKYNYSEEWKMPVAPEAYTRSGELFGDQYSNFNAGKLLLFLEGLAGIEYSVPENTFGVHDAMPTEWQWMEVRVPIRMPGEAAVRWPKVRYERNEHANTQSAQVTKSIRVADCPLQVTIEPWLEGKRLAHSAIQPAHDDAADGRPAHVGYQRYVFAPKRANASVQLRLVRRADED